MLQIINGTIIQSKMEIDESILGRLQNPANQQKVENAMKDLGVKHHLQKENDKEFSVVSAACHKDVIEEEDMKSVVQKHQDFLDYVSALCEWEDIKKPEADNDGPADAEPVNEEPTGEETKNASTITMEQLIEQIKKLKHTAADSGIGMTVFLEDKKDIHYIGFMPEALFALKILALDD